MKKISRRHFLKRTTSTFLICSSPLSLPQVMHNSERTFIGEIGVCSAIKNAPLLERNGFNYVEESVQNFLLPDRSEEHFLKNYNVLQKAILPVPVCNLFLPGSLKAVGIHSEHTKILQYAETAFKRAQKCATKIIVLGSSGSRNIPDGFNRSRAEEQFAELLTRMSPIAARYGIIICLEFLNKEESNFINTISEALEIIKTVNHPNLQLLVDFYHMLVEGDSAEQILKANKHVYHCHIAEEKERAAPGNAAEDFRPFLKNLKQIGYSGKLSIECNWKNMETELPVALKELRKQIAAV